MGQILHFNYLCLINQIRIQASHKNTSNISGKASDISVFLLCLQLPYNKFEMQSKQPASFFQISINTDKFAQFTNSLNQILSAHEKQLQLHTRQLAQLRQNTQEKVSRVRSQCEYQLDKLEKKRKEEAQHTASFHNDLTVKYQFLASEHRSKLAQLEEEVGELNTKVDAQEEVIKDKVVKQVEREVEELVFSSKAYMQRQMEAVGRKVKEMELSTASYDILMRNIINAYQNRSLPTPNEQDTIKESKTVDLLRYATADKFNIQQATAKEGRDRKRKKMQQRCEQQNLQYASISAKLEVLQTRLTAKENQSIDKVVYAKKLEDSLFEGTSDGNFNLSFGKLEAERKSLEEKISIKLESIEAIIHQNFERLQREIFKQSNQQLLLRDQLDIACRKLQKEKVKMNDLATQIKRLQDRRVDQKLIENMVTMFKRQHRTLQEELDKKLSTEGWGKEKQRLGQRMQIVSESLSEKADKEEIKRAFQFVEDKIKEIVLIIADDIHHQKEGAAKRIPFKCLSCDKDLESSLPTTLRHNSDKKLFRPPTTPQIRKKVRVAHNEQRV